MKKLPVAFLFLFFFLRFETSAGITLTAITHAGNASVTLQWNMVNYPGTTAYTLFKSIDGVVWEITAANPVFRNYTSSTILAYRDNFSDEQKLYYRVKVYDTNENIVDISNTAVVANPKKDYPLEKNPAPGNITTEVPSTTSRNLWKIYPNPAGDMLGLVYKGKDIIKGVINIVVQDATGKAVVRFRAASNNKQLYIPVSSLHPGFYFIKINVASEVQMNEKFIKQ
ncbi:MAG: T9SS type A sorting domain-containing protein [Ginsengibacter sp.]